MEDFCDICSQSGSSLQPFRFFVDNSNPDCQSCNIISETLRFFYPPSGPRQKVLLYPESFRGEQAFLALSDLDEDETPSRIVYYVRSEAEAKLLAQDVGGYFQSVYVHRDLDQTPSGKASLQQILAWDNNCRSTHPRCNILVPRLPTRVIDVASMNGACRLYESAGAHNNYMTLSHCWGNLKILTTTKDNLARHKKVIDFGTLPKTFQDAIEVTRHMGIQYIWIDSLCIVQDDLDDWARESSKMASIYQNSYLTLAATAARDRSEGLFKPRAVETCSLEICDKDYPDRSITLLARRGRTHDCLRGVQGDPWMNSDEKPLMTRAWVYQERLLSRRLLHFAADEMIWECHTETDCECSLIASRDPIVKDRKERGITDDEGLSDRSIFEILTSGEQRDSDAETQRWYQLIKNYTLLNITNDEDRLPAFSGIASSLIEAENYVAGIRKSYAVRDLLWFSLASTKPRRAHSYLAPSWSWASIIGGYGNFTIMYNYPAIWDAPGTSVLAEIKDVFTVKSTSDPFGRVKAGEMKIAGRCVKATVLEKDGGWIGSEWGSHRLRIEIPSLPGRDVGGEAMIDTIDDARSAVGLSITLLAMLETESYVYFLMLALRSLFSRKLRRIGAMRVSRGGQATGNLTKLAAESILDKSRSTTLVLV